LNVALRADDVGDREGTGIVTIFDVAILFVLFEFFGFAASAAGFGGFVGAVELLIGVSCWWRHDLLFVR